MNKMKCDTLQIVKVDEYTEIFCSNVKMILYLKNFLIHECFMKFEEVRCVAHKGIIFDMLCVKKDVLKPVVKEILKLKWEALGSDSGVYNFRKEYEE